MEQGVVIAIVFAVMMILLLTGQWIFVALGGAAVIGLIMLGGIQKLTASIAWAATDSWDLSCMPLFILLGELIFHSGLGTSLYTTVSLWLGRLPGGLLHTNVAAAALFASISGSTIATCATIGTVAIPEERRRGYSEKLILGSVAAAGSLGVLIPPSINMILYAIWVEVSLGKLFIGGVLPGIMMALLFMAYIGFACWRDPTLAPVSGQRAPWREKLRSLTAVVPIAIIVAVIWGGIYSGWMTATECAAVSALVAGIAVAAFGRMSWTVLKNSLLGAVRITCMCTVTLIGAKLLVTVVAYTGATRVLLDQVVALGLGPLSSLFLIYAIYIVLGCFLDGISLMLVTVPFVVPILRFFGIDLIWFGVTLILLLEISFLTPPVGINLFVVSAIANTDIMEVAKGMVPFFFMLCVGILILTFFPEVVMFLPNTMK